jgi:hypothetical protein
LKKSYSKPLISVEVLTLDQPIANICTADRQDVKDLMSFGYFSSDRSCEMWIGPGENGQGGLIDWDCDGSWDSTHDSVCYHSNVQTAFTS